MLKVQEYLQSHSYEDLENELGIKAKVYDDRVVLNYSQIDSPKHDPIVKECRALILSRPEHNVLSRAFDRFFNYGEDPNTDDFDISKSTIDEKIDGSLMPVYHDGAKWQVATRQMAFAEGETFNGRTFREVFIEAIGDDPDVIFKDIHKDLVIIFELVSPETRVVKVYEEPEVFLLDVRDRTSGVFYGREITYKWPITKTTKWTYPLRYKFETWDDCLKAVKELPTLDEGYVAVDGSAWRIKIKNPAYLAVAHLRMNGVMSEKRIILLVLMNDHEEYLNYFPEDQKNFDPYIEAYKNMILEIDHYWTAFKDTEVQKDFALAIKDCHAKNILFGMRNKKQTIEDVIENMTENAKVNLLKGYVGRKGDDICSRV
jgi:hypothetical protein